jgi:Ca2+-binding RTX toxin-like protein
MDGYTLNPTGTNIAELSGPDGITGTVAYNENASGSYLTSINLSTTDGYNVEQAIGTDGNVQYFITDDANREAWSERTALVSFNGTVIGDYSNYETADLWQQNHELTQAHLSQIDESAANYIAPEIERLAYEGGEAWNSTPGAFSFDPYFGDGYDFSAGDFNVDVGAYDNDPGSFDTTLDLTDDSFGYDQSGLDYWNDGGDWTYEAGDTYSTWDYGGWDYGDFFFPVILDLNGDGVDITPRTDSTAYFDVDADGYWEQVAWAGPQDGLLVIDLDINGNYGPDGIIDLVEEIAFFSDDPNVKTDLQALNAEFDTNGNHQLDAGDAHWSDFRVWVDANQDGWSDAGELSTLASLGITSISLVSDEKSFLLPDNTLINGFASFTRTVNGVTTTAALADAALAYDELGFYSQEAPGVGFTYYGEDGSVLPFIDSKVWVPDGYAVTAYYLPVDYALDDTWAGAFGGQYADTFSTTGVLGQTFYGDAGNDTLTGGVGDDVLDGGSGTDSIQGGGGDDTIYFEAAEIAQVNGGSGYDTGILTSSAAITISLAAYGFESFISRNGDDIITAAAGVGNYIDGRGGNDVVHGSGNDDILVGGAGNDTLNGNGGIDLLMGGAGNDTLSGHAGDDVIFGGEGADWLSGGDGVDKLDGGDGGDGGDRLAGGVGIDTGSFSSERASYTVVRNGVLTTVSGPDGVNFLTSVETLEFADLTLRNLFFTGDFNNDGRSDLALQNGSSSALWMMNGTTVGAGSGNVAPLGSGWSMIGAGDFNLNGTDDFVLQNGQTLALWQMDGTSISIGSGNIGTLGAGWMVTGISDLSGDGRSDLVLQNGQQLALWAMNGTAIQSGSSGNIGTLGAGWAVAGTGDFTGDGRGDLLLQNGQQLALWAMDGTAIQPGSSGNIGTLGAGWMVAGVADATGDGKSDILLQNGQTLALWAMDGTAIQPGSSGNIGTLGAGWTLAGNGDFNGDSHADLLLQNGSQLAEWLLNGATVIGGGGIGSLAPGWDLL